MRVNPKIYNLVTTEPMEVQEVDGHKIEIYKLNEYPGIQKEFTKKGKFVVWSSVDGVNYRLLIEEGYSEALKDLYTAKVNAIWLKFWDNCEKISNKFSRKIILPMTLVVMVALFVLIGYIPDNLQMTFSIGLLVVFIVVTTVLRKFTNNKISVKNGESIEEIKKILGVKKFEQLLETQRGYIDEYFGYNEEETEADEETSEANVIDAKEETTEVSKIETKEKNTEVGKIKTKAKVTKNQTKE